MDIFEDTQDQMNNQNQDNQNSTNNESKDKDNNQENNDSADKKSVIEEYKEWIKDGLNKHQVLLLREDPII